MPVKEWKEKHSFVYCRSSPLLIGSVQTLFTSFRFETSEFISISELASKVLRINTPTVYEPIFSRGPLRKVFSKCSADFRIRLCMNGALDFQYQKVHTSKRHPIGFRASLVHSRSNNKISSSKQTIKGKSCTNAIIDYSIRTIVQTHPTTDVHGFARAGKHFTGFFKF